MTVLATIAASLIVAAGALNIVTFFWNVAEALTSGMTTITKVNKTANHNVNTNWKKAYAVR